MAGISSEKIDLLIYGQSRPILENGFSDQFVLHFAEGRADLERLTPDVVARIRGMAVTYHVVPADKTALARFPKLEIVASFGVGYDHVDSAYAREHNIVVTNTPDVLTEEVADVAMGLLIATLREFVKADRYVRSGLWADPKLSRSASARCATARSASSAWAGSARRSGAGSRPRSFRCPITRAIPRPASRTSIIPT